jgi:hypothetical protein
MHINQVDAIKSTLVDKAIFLVGVSEKVKVRHGILPCAIVSGHGNGPRRRLSALTATVSCRGGD